LAEEFKKLQLEKASDDDDEGGKKQKLQNLMDCTISHIFSEALPPKPDLVKLTFQVPNIDPTNILCINDW
jgi:hypothetical protein